MPQSIWKQSKDRRIASENGVDIEKIQVSRYTFSNRERSHCEKSAGTQTLKGLRFLCLTAALKMMLQY